MKKVLCLCLAISLALMLSLNATAHEHSFDIPLRPAVSKWAQTEVEAAQKYGLIPWTLTADFQMPITREMFRAVAMNYIALQNQCDVEALYAMTSQYLGEGSGVFLDGNSEDGLASRLGVVTGRGDGNFDPKGLISRQEAATMLMRAYQVCGGTLPEEAQEIRFSDQNDIAAWAGANIQALAYWKIMNGIDEGIFAPDDYLSVEQCIVTFLRLYTRAPVNNEKENVHKIFNYEQSMDYVTKLNSYEEFRLEGDNATVLSMTSRGMMFPVSRLYIVYHNGGVREIDIGLCVNHGGVAVMPNFVNPHLSDDGKIFISEVALTEDTYIVEGTLLHKRGNYVVSISLQTGMVTVEDKETVHFSR